HFFHHDHGGVLVQRLVDGDHLAHLHQHLDQLGRLHRHLVSQFGHSDGFWHRDFQRAEFLLLLLLLVIVAVIATTATTRATAPAGAITHATRAVATGLDFLLLAVGVVRPSR